jgi:hypothetical protein
MDPSSLGEALPREMARVRDKILPVYATLGPSGMPGSVLMRAELDRAAKAMIEGDTIEMLRVYQSLKEWQL